MKFLQLYIFFCSYWDIYFQGDSSGVNLSSGLQNNGDEEGDSTQADISLDDSSLVQIGSVPGGDDKDPTDFSDTTEDDVSEGNHMINVLHGISEMTTLTVV